jgi:uncharacterized membrane protein (DUF373 family)
MTPPTPEPAEGASHRVPALGRGTRMLQAGDSIVYLVVGCCFLLVAAFSLLSSLFTFSAALADIVAGPGPALAGRAAPAIIDFVSNLLLTLIILEVMGTVVHYLQTRATSLKPFLYIGIISATRGILAVGARLSVSDGHQVGTAELRSWMVELGVNAAVVIALGLTLRLIGPYLDDTSSRPPEDTHDGA